MICETVAALLCFVAIPTPSHRLTLAVGDGICAKHPMVITSKAKKYVLSKKPIVIVIDFL